MENNERKLSALDNFLGKNTDENNEITQDQKDQNSKKVILNQREGLIERVDKIFITEQGKQLLREQY